MNILTMGALPAVRLMESMTTQEWNCIHSSRGQFKTN